MSVKRIAALLGLLALTGCPKPTPTRPPTPPEQEVLAPEVKRISHEVELILQQQDELVWKHWTEGAPLDIDQTYAGKEGLFSPASIHKVDRLRQLSKDAREVRALTSLEVHLVGEHLAGALTDVNDAVANLEASMTFTVEGKEYAYRDLDKLLANEKTAARRRALYDAATVDVERLSQSLRRRQDKLERLLGELGYRSYEAYGAELRQANLEKLGLLAEEILQATQKPFTTVMGQLSQKELGVPLEKLTRADLPRLFRPSALDALFPKEQLLPRAYLTFHEMNINVEHLPNLEIDDRELPAKNPRSLTVAVKVPSDVRVSVKPASGEREQGSILHELGHAAHFAFTTEPRFELAKLGNGTVAEAFAFLLEDLMRDPLWLEEKCGLGGERLDQYLSAASAHQLFLIRRAAGRLLYALQVHRPGVQDPSALYAALLARTYALPSSKEDAARFLVDQEDFYQSADNFRGWFLAGQLQGQLKARFGPTWWHSPKAGEFLKFLWAKGNALSATELARLAGEDGIKPDVLLLRLGSALKVPISLSAVSAPPRPAAPAPAPTVPPAMDAGIAPTSADAGTAPASSDAGVR